MFQLFVLKLFTFDLFYSKDKFLGGVSYFLYTKKQLVPQRGCKWASWVLSKKRITGGWVGLLKFLRPYFNTLQNTPYACLYPGVAKRWLGGALNIMCPI